MASAHHPSHPTTIPSAPSTSSSHSRAFLQRRAVAALKSYFSEAHPFERYPTTMRMHAVSVGHYVRPVLRTAGLFFPLVFVFFGWPAAAKAAMLWKEGVPLSHKTEKGRTG